MDPVGVITALLGVVNYLRAASEKVNGNQKQCHRLADHAVDVLTLIEGEVKGGLSPDVLKRLHRLKLTLLDLNSTLEDLANKPMLKKILWRDDVGDRIAQVYKDLSEAVLLFNLGSKIDLRRFQDENEVARRADAAQMERSFQTVQKNDQELLKHLEIHKAQMQEAMMAIHKHLLHLRGSVERKFLEGGMHAMRCRSGGMEYIPDLFVITSLDVIIYHQKKIGEGGFGQVYEADWQGSRVAVKVLDKRIPSFIFQKEIDIWKRLRHPNILEFFGACSIADPPFSVCALKSHGDSTSYLHHHPSADRRKLIYEASLGLRYLHQNDVVHGDLKASNILIDEHGNACLCDFGLSKIRTHTTTVLGPSQTLLNHGSPRWMSPEQMALGIINKMTDIYSFGMTVYEVFTGMPPFPNTLDRLLFDIVVDRGTRPPRPSEILVVKSGLDDSMWKLVDECWSQKPRDRPVAATVTTRLLSIISAGNRDGLLTVADTSFVQTDRALAIPFDKYLSPGDIPTRPQVLELLTNTGLPSNQSTPLSHESEKFIHQNKQSNPLPLLSSPVLGLGIDATPWSPPTAESAPRSSRGIKARPSHEASVQKIVEQAPNQVPELGYTSSRLDSIFLTATLPTFSTRTSAPYQPLLEALPLKQTGTPPLTAVLPAIPSLTDASQAIKDTSCDPATKVAWCRDVYFIVDRLQQNVGLSAKPTAEPALITDPQLNILFQYAVTTVLQISSPNSMPSPMPLHIAEAIYLRGSFTASPAYSKFIRHSPRTAFRDFEQAAKGGYAMAWFKLGKDYEHFSDFALAKECFERGVELGVESCTYRMGMAHLMGQLGLPASTEKAVPLLHRAATLASINVPQPACTFGLLLLAEFSNITIPPEFFSPYIPSGSSSQQEACRHLERAAYLNFAPAQYRIGLAYEFADTPFPFDPSLSVQYYSLASQQGLAEADMALSKWFLCGAGGSLEKDEGLAFKFAKNAARKGLPSAEFAMGYFAEAGIGGPVDIKVAKKWYTKASKHGDSDATDRVSELLQLETVYSGAGTSTSQVPPPRPSGGPFTFAEMGIQGAEADARLKGCRVM